MSTASQVPKDTHTIEIHEESYGFTLAHRCNGRVLYVATYQNAQETIRQARRLAEQEQADGHEVIVVSDPHMS